MRTRLVLEGCLDELSSDELKRVWETIETSDGASIEVDLSSITHISKAGAKLLGAMQIGGVVLTADTPLTKSWVDDQLGVIESFAE